MVYPRRSEETFPGSLLLSFRRDPLKTITRIMEEYGDVSHFKVGRRHIYLVNDPDFIKAVLITNQKNFVKGQRSHSGLRFLGDGLLASEGGPS